MTLPSKELLRAVLNADINSLSIIDESNIKVQGVEWWEECNINIYELQHKIKEWASVCGYSLSSFWCFEKQDWSCWIEQKDGKFMGMNNYYHADTEFEAIFRAAQYIYDTLDNKYVHWV